MSPKTESLTSDLAGIVGEVAVEENPQVTVAGKSPAVRVRPKSVDEVGKVLAFANDHGLGVIPTGSGTKLETGNPPEKFDVLLDLTGLDQIVEYDAENLTIAAQAGVRVKDLVELVGKDGLFFPADPSFPGEATIGGVVATSDNGPKRFQHGNLRDVVLGVKVVLPNGELVKFGGRTIKNVSGYDVTKMMIGSMGILGVIVEATFRLLPQPQREDVLVHAFPRLTDVAKLSGEVLDSVLVPSSLELISSAARRLLKGVTPDFAQGEYLLVVGLEGHPDAVARQEKDLTSMCANLAPNRTALVVGGDCVAEGKKPSEREVACEIHESHETCNCQTVTDQATVESLWNEIYNLERTAKEAGYPVAAKVAVPLSIVWEMAQAAEKSAAANSVEVAYKISAGNGILNLYLKGDNENILAVLEDLRTLAEKREGSLVLKSSPVFNGGFETWGDPQGAYVPLIKATKAKFDPNGILNVGRYMGRV